MIRKATICDLDAVVKIFDEVHTAEEAGDITVGWIREIYPTRATAEASLERDDLFVLEEDGSILGAGIINKIQVDVYCGAPWEFAADDDKVCVLHTLVISPSAARRGLGKEFVAFYEGFARKHGCTELRLDTNARNTAARAMYKKLGYSEIATVPTTFNGIPGVDLVLLEKGLNDKSIVHCVNRLEWRAWLEEHFETESEVWFVFPSKDSGEIGVSYNDAVEEALCFGWIDGQAGTLDETHQLRRFTPRRPGSPYSRPNIERLILLDKEGKIHPKIKPSVEEIINTPYTFPEDILAAIRADGAAWKNYEAFSESYKRIRVAYIDAARKRPAEFEKRLANFIKKTRENKLIVGYGGVDKYYV